MKARARELKAEERANLDKTEGESAALAAIAAMQEPDRFMAERLHAIIKASAPALSPKTWYGMPAYARDGKIVCFFQTAQKFNTQIRDVRLQRRGEPRRRRPVASRLRAEGVDRRRRGKDHRAREESGELRMKASTNPSPKGKSPSQQIDAIIKEPGDWRGKKLITAARFDQESRPCRGRRSEVEKTLQTIGSPRLVS